MVLFDELFIRLPGFNGCLLTPILSLLNIALKCVILGAFGIPVFIARSKLKFIGQNHVKLFDEILI